MKELLIATTNPGKLGEITRFLSDLPITLTGLKEAGVTDKVEETGTTFEENAILKAKFYCEKTGLPTIADDGGLEVEALGGEPGVRSHRWIHGDREDTDEELIAHTVRQMKGISLEKRNAQLRAVLVLALPNGEVFTAEAATRGIIPLEAGTHRTEGFPYRSLLFIPELNKFYDHSELTDEENTRYNHRRKALEKLKPFIVKHLSLRGA